MAAGILTIAQCREIAESVGPAMSNKPADVLAAQKQLNYHLPHLQPAQATIAETSVLDEQTKQAIVAFQRYGMKHTTPSGRVHPRGPTMRALNQLPGSPAIGTSSKPPGTATLTQYIDALNLRHFTTSEIVRLMSNVRRFTPDPSNPHHNGLPTVVATNSKPPRDIWDNFIPIILVLDEIREQLDYGLTITNTYRSKAYNDGLRQQSKARNVIKRREDGDASANMSNASSGVALTSQHMAFRAIDWYGSEGNVSKWYDKAKEMRGRRFPLPWPITMKNVTIAGRTLKFKDAGLLLTDGDFEYHGGIGKYNPSNGNFIHIDCRGIDKDW